MLQNNIDSNNRVTVATCCYDKDWRLVLSENYLAKVFAKFKYDFYEKLLIINTQNNREEIEIAAEREVKNGNIDNYYFVSDVLDEVKKALNIKDFLYYQKLKLLKKHNKMSMFKSIIKNAYNFYFSNKGTGKKININTKVYDCINYSVGPLSAIIKATGDYLLYFTEDCIIDDSVVTNWIDDSIEHLNTNKHLIASRPIDMDLDQNWFNVYESLDNFYVCYMFTDRMFLGNIVTLKNIDFNCEDCGKYPAYGGAGFEARVFNYMNKNDKRTLISKTDKYIHEYDEYIDFIKK